MLGEPEAVAESDVSEEAPSAEVAETEVETEVVETEEQPVDDDEDFDWEGKKLRLPKALKSKIENLDRDYTQKTQKVAETRKELEARASEIEQQAKASEAELKTRATVITLEEQIKPYADLTQAQWQQWAQEDFIAADQGWKLHQHLIQRHQAALNDLTKLQNERSEQAKSEHSKRLQDTENFARTIPGWTPEVGGKIADYAASKGIDRATLEANITPAFYDILHKAWIGEQALRKQAAPKPAPTTVEPTKTVTGRANPLPPTGLDDRLSQDEWLKRRNAQIAARR